MPDGRGGRGRQGAGGPGGSCWGWGRWVVGQEGQMTGMVGQEADGREPDGAGQGQGGPDGQEGGNGSVHEGQMAVAGGSTDSMEQEFKIVGRQGPDQG